MRRIYAVLSVCILTALVGCQSKPAATPAATTEGPKLGNSPPRRRDHQGR